MSAQALAAGERATRAKRKLPPEAVMNEGTMIVGNVVGLLLMFAIPFVAGGLYLLFTGQFKLLFLLLFVLALVTGYLVVGCV